MAKSRIKGITIEIDGNTTGLQESLSDVNKKSIDLQSELRDVERLLKFDPGNTEALAQKQELLARQIQNTEEKLQRLKDAQEQVDQKFSSGDIGEEQYRAFRREIEFTERELENLQNSLQDVDSGNDIQQVRRDMQQLDESTDEAADGVEGLGNELLDLAAGAAAVGTIGEAIEQALDTSSLDTKIDISMEVSEESKQAVKEAGAIVESYGVDSEAALEGIRRQWALNADASDESNSRVVQGAAAICAAYGDVDFTELIQESNELADCLNISDEQALGMVDSLLKIGFPPDQIDIITEYGSQLERAGYSAEEIQGIMAAGVETGTWNIDVLLDGLKEGRIVLAEFGQGVDAETAKLFQKVGISGEQLQKWGQAVAEGGEGGKTAMQEVAKALSEVDDKTLQNQLGTKIFGTLWEENGENITDTILGMSDNLGNAEENMEGLNSSVETLNSDPAVAMSQAISQIQLALAPVMLAIANVIGKIAEWIQANPQLSAAIVAIVSVITILVGILTTLAPIFTAVATAASALGVGIGAVSLPLIAIIAVIAAVVAAGVLLYKNWDTVKAKAIELKNQVVNAFNNLKSNVMNTFNNLKSSVINSINALKSGVINTVNNIKNGFINTFNNMKSRVIQVAQSIKDGIINKIKGINLVNIGKNAIQGLINGIKSKVNAVKDACKNVANAITSKVKGILGIHSPSRVMMELGEYTGEGLVQGLDNKIKAISSKSKQMANSITSNFNPKTSNTTKSKEIDYSRLGNILLESFKEAIKTTGMNNPVIEIDKVKLSKTIADTTDKLSGERLQLKERWQL